MSNSVHGDSLTRMNTPQVARLVRGPDLRVITLVALLAACAFFGGCAESVRPMATLDGAVGDAALDGSTPGDSATLDFGFADAVRLPTYNPCDVEECGPGDTCIEVSVLDPFGFTRVGGTCSPPCSVDTECPPIGVQTAACLPIATGGGNACVVRCDPEGLGQCAAAQQCAYYASEHWCLPYRRR